MCSTNEPNSRSSTSPTTKAGSITIRTRLLRSRFPAMMPWTDTKRPLAERVEALLGEMTLDEKLAQLGSVWVGARARLGQRRADAGGVRRARVRSRRRARTGWGTSRARSAPSPVDPVDGARRLAALQSDLVERTRLEAPGDRARGVPDRASPPSARPSSRRRSALGGDVRSRDRRADDASRSARACARSARTRACRPCSTSCATTAGAASRRRSARTRTWSA